MSRRVTSTLVLVVAVLVVAAAAVGYAAGRRTAPEEAASGSSASTGSAPSTADVRFAQMMAAHHEQAVLMAGLAATHATPQTRLIAAGIATSQDQELGLLRGWLRLWGEPASSSTAMAASMSSMPGMASPAQLNRLYTLHGRAFDALFFQLMIRHHEGGIAMAHDAVVAPGLAPVRDAARSMIVEQVDDLSTMRAALRADGARPLPAP